MSVQSVAIIARMGPEAQQYAGELRRLIARSGTMRVVAPKTAEVIILLGGDGFLLSAIHKYQELGKPFLGINFGDVGFFTNPRIRPWRLVKLLGRLARNFKSQWFPFVQVIYKTPAGETHAAFAFNEVMVERMAGQALHLDIAINGVPLNNFSGDGVMVATPQGSTGYAINLGGGGAAVHPEVSCMMLVPVNPQKAWKYRSLLFPVVLPKTGVVEISNRSQHKRPVRLVCDGKKFGEVFEVAISFVDRAVSLLEFSDPKLRADYIKKLVDKIIGPPREE